MTTGFSSNETQGDFCRDARLRGGRVGPDPDWLSKANFDPELCLDDCLEALLVVVFGIGAMLAGLAGMLVTPILGATSGMGEQIIISTFVVIVVGGIGSIRGAFIAAVLIGLIDTLGRSFIDVLLLTVLSSNAAEAAGPALSSMLIYLFMVIVLFVRPQGLFPPRGAGA